MRKQEFRVLSGWKQVARYSDAGVRTVQRYERESGLPIRRPAGNLRGSVFAVEAELRDWVVTREKRSGPKPDADALSTRTNTLGANFLLIDSELAPTFSELAMDAADGERREHSARIARKAYGTIAQLRLRIHLLAADKVKLDANLHGLKGELQSIGKTF